MKNGIVFFVVIASFVLGAFSGGKIVNNKESVFAELDLGEFGSFSIGKKINLTKIENLSEPEKILLVSGIIKLDRNDEIAKRLTKAIQRGDGLFKPAGMRVRLHIANDEDLKDSIAAICDRNEDNSIFYKKTLIIYGEPGSMSDGKMVRVGAWEKKEHALCHNDTETKHVWINRNTAKNLIPGFDTVNVNQSELYFQSKVSKQCNAAFPGGAA